VVDELTYRARSTIGRTAFAPLKKHMIVVGRVVRVGDDWVVSGNPATFPAWARDQMLVAAAQEAMRSPEAVFRNPEKLAQARRLMDEQHDLFGADLIVVAGSEVPGRCASSTTMSLYRSAPTPSCPIPLSLAWTRTCSSPIVSRSTSCPARA
jgi:hypothetical protein